MEAGVQRLHRFEITLFHGQGRLGHDPAKRNDEPVGVGLHSEAQSVGFKQAARHADFGDLVGIGIEDIGAALRPDLHKAFALELEQGFTHRSTARVQLECDLLVRQLFAGFAPSLNDPVADCLCDRRLKQGTRLAGSVLC